MPGKGFIYVTNNEKFKDIRVAYGKARVAKDKILMDSVVATEAITKASAVADSLFFATVDATYYKLVMDNKESLGASDDDQFVFLSYRRAETVV